MASPRLRLRFGSVPDALLLVLLVTVATAFAAPADPAMGPSEIPVEVQMPSDQVIYDQRQNGTENLRVQMSGVTVVLAPAEAILALAPSDLMDSGVRPKLSHPSQMCDGESQCPGDLVDITNDQAPPALSPSPITTTASSTSAHIPTE